MKKHIEKFILIYLCVHVCIYTCAHMEAERGHYVSWSWSASGISGLLTWVVGSGDPTVTQQEL